MAEDDTRFAGAIPALYEQYLVPLIFAPYARDLARRAAMLPADRVLEIAAGTGVLTRELAACLPPRAAIVATDLNAAMLAQAAHTGAARAVQWQQADAMQLPFDDGSFDLVACQFGIMFFPDRAAALAEARRMLRPGGTLLFSTWDRIEDNVFAQAVTDALARVFPDDPPRFLARVPHGYHDAATLRRDVEAGGLTLAGMDTVTATSRADNARVPAVAYCAGTPLRNEIEARDPAGLDAATAAAEVELAHRFGDGPVSGRIQAIVVAARKPSGA
jgi:SAM-dependent methyltransferase